MDDPWSAAIAEAYASAPLDDVILQTLEFRHELLEAPFRIVADWGEITSYDENGQPLFGWNLVLEGDAPTDAGKVVEFTSCGFNFTLPDQQVGQLPSVSVTIDNVAHLLTEKLDSLIGVKATLDMTYREYLASDTTEPQFVLGGLSFSSVKSNLTQITGTASYANLINRNFPNRLYRGKDFPGLSR